VAVRARTALLVRIETPVKGLLGARPKVTAEVDRIVKALAPGRPDTGRAYVTELRLGVARAQPKRETATARVERRRLLGNHEGVARVT